MPQWIRLFHIYSGARKLNVIIIITYRGDIETVPKVVCVHVKMSYRVEQFRSASTTKINELIKFIRCRKKNETETRTIPFPPSTQSIIYELNSVNIIDTISRIRRSTDRKTIRIIFVRFFATSAKFAVKHNLFRSSRLCL